MNSSHDMTAGENCTPYLLLSKFGKKLILSPAMIFIVFMISVSPVFAEQNDCEKLAKEYQKEHFGDLIFVQPLKDNGAYDLGDYKGHWMNKAWNKEMGNYYYDPVEKAYYNTEHAIMTDFEQKWNRKVVVFNVNKGGTPFPLKYHY